MCLALASVAYGATHPYAGNSDGHVVEFDAKVHGGHVARVVQFAYGGFSMQCDAGLIPFSGSFFEAKVNDKGPIKVGGPTTATGW